MGGAGGDGRGRRGHCHRGLVRKAVDENGGRRLGRRSTVSRRSDPGYERRHMSNAVRALQTVRVAALAALLGMPALAAIAQESAITMPLNDAALVQPRHVTVRAARYRDSDALEVRQTGP